MYNFDEIINRRDTQSVKWDECRNNRELPMWVADMDFKTAPCVIDALRRRVDHGIFGYTHPGDSYYNAITHWFTKHHNWTINRDHVIPTTGVVPAISAIVKALAKPGQGVILQTPVYTCFFSSVRNNGCRIVENPLLRDGERFVMDYDDLERKCADPDTVLLILCNPHNPAGRVWTRDELARLDEICTRHGVTVVSDEIHCEIVFKPLTYTPFATVATAPSVSCISPSKAFNIAGLQIANIVAPDDARRAAIDRAININETCDVGPMGVEALIAAYNGGADWLEAMIDYVHGNYELLRDTVNSRQSDLHVLPLEGTYLAWVDVRPLTDDVAAWCETLRQGTGLWLHPGTMYGDHGQGYVRVNLATPRANVVDALQRLKSHLQ